MPTSKRWLPREGFTSDAVGPWIKGTVFNPIITLPLFLLAKYTNHGRQLASTHTTAFSNLRLFFILGLVRLVNNALSRRALNNALSDPYDFKRELVLITGGSDGIGKEVTLLLASRDVRVVVLDVQPLTYTPPPPVTYYNCDITSTVAISTVAKTIRAVHGPPTILINNAGVARGKTILDSTESDVRLTFDVNTLSHYFLAREFLPSMVSANHGMFVTVASLASYVTTANLVDYASSKAAALSFHEGLKTELVTRYSAPKVRTVLITQGFTKTPLFQGWNQKTKFMDPVLEVESVAEAIVESVLKGESGQVILPGFNGLMSPILRALPDWWSISVRNHLEKYMTRSWHGRQVIDPEIRYGFKEKGA
ncbi:MAG: hypothetical protein Q9160_007546 [Pyrenula sp. 1 TL-2023]